VGSGARALFRDADDTLGVAGSFPDRRLLGESFRGEFGLDASTAWIAIFTRNGPFLPALAIKGVEYLYARHSSGVPMRIWKTLEHDARGSRYQQEGEMHLREDHRRAGWVYL